MLYSFDVFDTLITRKTATPKGIFALMQKSLFSDLRFKDIDSWIKNNFFYIRINAEKQAWKMFASAGETEICLDDIYRALSNTLSLSQEQSDSLKELEIKTELENVLPIKENIEKAIALCNKKEQVILISDMYLNEETIREMLISADERLNSVPLFVSSKYKKNKSSKQLFQLIKEQYRISYSDWIHYGDNEVSDVSAPKALGIKTDCVALRKVLPIEQYALQNHEDNAYFQKVIGAGINARLSNNKVSRSYVYGTSIIVPIIYGYSRWIVNWAQKNDIKDLFFIARDGFVIKEVVDRILDKFHVEITTHYIYGSRKAWRLVALGENFWDLQELFRWSGSVSDMTFSYIAKCFEVSEDTLNDYIDRNYSPEEIVNYSERQDIIIRLNNNKAFREYIIKEQAEKRKLVLDYLKNEVGTNRSNYAFVDFVGSGYTQKCLSRLLLEITDYPTKTLFYRLDSDLSDDHCLLYTYNGAQISKDIVEAMLFAPHGSTTGYECLNNKICPTLDCENTILQEYGMSDFIEGLCDTVKLLDEKIDVSLKMEQLYINYIENTPDIDLAGFIGDIPFSKSIKEDVLTYAPKLSNADIEDIFAIRTIEPISYFYKGIDLDYSIKRCSDDQKKEIEIYKKNFLSIEARKRRINYWKNSETRWEHVLGYDNLFNSLGKRIIVYGAGRCGTVLVDVILASSDKHLVAWVDQKYEEIQNSIIVVEPVEAIIEKRFDSILIAIVDKRLQEDVLNNLQIMKIEMKKVFCI